MLVNKNVLPEKGLLEKAATMKRFEYQPLGSELKEETSISEKQCQELDKVDGINTTVLNEKHVNLDLVYNNFHFNKFSVTDEDVTDLSDDKKYKHLQKFLKKINELRKVKSRMVGTKKEMLS